MRRRQSGVGRGIVNILKREECESKQHQKNKKHRPRREKEAAVDLKQLF